MKDHGIDGPFVAPTPLVDKVIFWLSGFVAGFLLALFTIGK